MKQNSIHRAVREGRAALGTGLKEFATRGVPHIIASSGFDYCMIDMEHGAFDLETIADLAGWFGVVLFHRGSWCPPCNAQLAAFARAADKFAGEGIKVVSVSIDDREKIGKSTSSISRSLTAPTRERLPQSPAPSSMTIPSVSRQPASSSIPKAGWWRPCIRPAQSAV